VKTKIKKIIKNFASFDILNKLVLILFLTHLMLAHVVLQNYYLCFESDGNIVLESVSDKDDCCSPTEAEGGNDDNEACSFCEDVSISENCDEYYSIAKNKIQLISSFEFFNSNTNYSVDQIRINYSTINQNLGSPHLDSHKTVLLLI